MASEAPLYRMQARSSRSLIFRELNTTDSECVSRVASRVRTTTSVSQIRLAFVTGIQITGDQATPPPRSACTMYVHYVLMESLYYVYKRIKVGNFCRPTLQSEV